MSVLQGFDGKLPSRGDFVTAGLPRGFLDPWRAWLDRSLAASQALLGAGWVTAWLTAPVWHFALAAGVAGPDAVAGLIFPSVDRAGRHYPMTLAAVLPGFVAAPDAPTAWRQAAETAGLAALAEDHPPELLAAALAASAWTEDVGSLQGCCEWWTAGGVDYQARGFSGEALPGADEFVGMMVDDGRGARDFGVPMNVLTKAT